jgi:hypothetical protein
LGVLLRGEKSIRLLGDALQDEEGLGAVQPLATAGAKDLMQWTCLLGGRAPRSQNDVRGSGNHSRAEEASPMPQVSVLGIDIAKQIFHVVGMDDSGAVVLRKRLPRGALIPFMAQLPPVVIGMEACGGAHDWARRFSEHGHQVR